MEPDGTEYPTQAIGAVYTDTKLIATVWGNEKVTMPWRSNREAEANARLIAAAPRLLAALEAIYASLRVTRGVPSIDVALLNEARDASAEARGQKS
jgi:hypothetical protein